MKKLYLTNHARKRLRERKLSFPKVLENFDRFSYLYDDMEIDEKRPMKIKHKKKFLTAVIGKRADNVFFVVTVYSEKRGVLPC